MLRKVFRTGNSTVVSLPREALDFLGIQEGQNVSVDLDRENRQIVIALADHLLMPSLQIPAVSTRTMALAIAILRNGLEPNGLMFRASHSVLSV